MKNRIWLFLLLIIVVYPALSQEPEKKITWKDRIFFGGNLSLSLGSLTWVEVSPIIGYRLSQRVVVGTGATYIYYDNDFTNFSTNIYGGKLFAQYTLIKNLGDFLPMGGYTSIFAHVENEMLSVERSVADPGVTGRIAVDNLWIGPGLKQKLGVRSGVYLLVLWNALENKHSIYSSPTIRFGFIF